MRATAVSHGKIGSARRSGASNPLLYVDPLGLEVKNRYPGPIIIKPENGGPGVVPPGKTYPGKIDGVVGPDGKWIKFYGKDWLPDNKVEVLPDGEVKCVGGLCMILPGKPQPVNPDDTWTIPRDPKEVPGCKPN